MEKLKNISYVLWKVKMIIAFTKVDFKIDPRHISYMCFSLPYFITLYFVIYKKNIQVDIECVCHSRYFNNEHKKKATRIYFIMERVFDIQNECEYLHT